MSAPCDFLVMTFGEDGYPNGCLNDTTGEMKCEDCNNWCGGYACPANDEIYYYRLEKGLNTCGYMPSMTKEEFEEWCEECSMRKGE